MTRFAYMFGTAKRLGWEIDDMRALAGTLFGTPRLRALSDHQCTSLVDAMRKKAGEDTSRPMRRPHQRLSGPYAAKCQALWIAAFNLGVIHNKTDEALIAFIRRQTGLEAAHWMIAARSATRVIEALKAMLARAGCDLTDIAGAPPLVNDPRYRVTHRQCALLAQLGELPERVASVEAQALHICGKGPRDLEKGEWQRVQNQLGTRLRRALLRQQKGHST